MSYNHALITALTPQYNNANALDTYTHCGPMCNVSSMRWYTVLECWESMKGESLRLGRANARFFFCFLFSSRS